jgi:hypothetical protein
MTRVLLVVVVVVVLAVDRDGTQQTKTQVEATATGGCEQAPKARTELQASQPQVQSLALVVRKGTKSRSYGNA